MCVIIFLVVWTTTGTFMLMFLAALQDLPVEIDEAAALDGVDLVAAAAAGHAPDAAPDPLPGARRSGLIGTWQVFDQIYVMSQGSPAKTTLTPAFLSYSQSFRSLRLRDGRGHGVHPLPDHRRAHRGSSAGVMDEDRVPWRTRRRLARAASLRQDSTRAAAGSIR